MARYAIIGADQRVANVVEWDGETEWSPPEGSSAVACPPFVGRGWALLDGEWQAPAQEPDPSDDPA